MNGIIPFSAHFAVFKLTSAPGKTHPDVWAGHRADGETKTVVWDTGPPTTYGPNSVEDQDFYSDACLAKDVADGKRLYEAVAKLMSQPPAITTLGGGGAAGGWCGANLHNPVTRLPALLQTCVSSMLAG
jgi:hypothetical protein